MENSFYQLAEIEISYRPKFKAADRPQIDSSQKAYHLLLDNWNKDRIELLEEFKIILLNRRNRVLGIVNISQGGIAGTMADPKIIFAIALKACASGIILSHRLTRKLTEAGKLLELNVFDHIIVCSEGYYSFLDQGLI
jgi:DNA repair protein RadC